MNIGQGLTAAAMHAPGRTAAYDEGVTLTYAELCARTEALAGGLQELGVRPGDRVALLMLNEYRYLELLYGITGSGGVMVPLNARLAVHEWVFMLNDCEASMLVLHPEFLPTLPAIAAQVPSLRTFVLAADDLPGTVAPGTPPLTLYEAVVRARVRGRIDNVAQDDDLAAIFYTGGTTGTPKGVMLTHGNLLANTYQVMPYGQMTDEDVYLHAMPMFHLADTGGTCGVTLYRAAHAHIRTFDPVRMLDAIQRWRVTTVTLAPTAANMLLRCPALDDYDLSSLRRITYGASPMPVEVLRQLMQRLPQVEFGQAYGMTEASPVLTVLTSRDHRLDDEKAVRRLASAGKPVAGVDVRTWRPWTRMGTFTSSTGRRI